MGKSKLKKDISDAAGPGSHPQAASGVPPAGSSPAPGEAGGPPLTGDGYAPGAHVDAEVTDPDELLAHTLIYDLEKAGRTGHGMDADRELHLQAAVAIRGLIGLGVDEPLIYPGTPAPYGEVVAAPPVGHSLP